MGELDHSLKIYLAGKMSGLNFDEMYNWRAEIANMIMDYARLSGYNTYCFNPVKYYSFKESIHQSEKEIMDFDLHHVLSSDLIIVNLDQLSSSIGTAIEIHRASEVKIPIIAFGSDEEYKKVHPWVQSGITRVEPDMDSAVRYIHDFYMI